MTCMAPGRNATCRILQDVLAASLAADIMACSCAIAILAACACCSHSCLTNHLLVPLMLSWLISRPSHVQLPSLQPVHGARTAAQ